MTAFKINTTKYSNILELKKQLYNLLTRVTDKEKALK